MVSALLLAALAPATTLLGDVGMIGQTCTGLLIIVGIIAAFLVWAALKKASDADDRAGLP